MAVEVREGGKNLEGYKTLVREAFLLYDDEELARREIRRLRVFAAANKRFDEQSIPSVEELLERWQWRPEKKSWMKTLNSMAKGSKKATEFIDAVDEALDHLSGIERVMLTLRFKLDCAEEGLMNFGKIGGEFGLSRERPRQIIQKALGKLKHPSSSKIITPLLAGSIST